MQCPKCGLINPDTAMWCDCGYDFQAHAAETTEVKADDNTGGIPDEREENTTNQTLLSPARKRGWTLVVLLALPLATVVSLVPALLLSFFLPYPYSSLGGFVGGAVAGLAIGGFESVLLTRMGRWHIPGALVLAIWTILDRVIGYSVSWGLFFNLLIETFSIGHPAMLGNNDLQRSIAFLLFIVTQFALPIGLGLSMMQRGRESTAARSAMAA